MISGRRLSVLAAGGLVIDDVSIRVGAGECVGLSGARGSGKTALLQALAGRVELAAGSIHLDGDDRPAAALLLRRRVAYAAVEAMVGNGLTVDEYLRFVARVRAPRNQRQTFAYTAGARRVGLDLSAAIASLAPVQLALLAIVAAGLTPVSAILIDGGIDVLTPAQREPLMSWLVEIRDRGVAMLVATNDADVQNALCHRVVKLAKGAVAEEWTLTASPSGTGHAPPEARPL